MRVVAALVALLVVAGCHGDPDPKEPKPSTSVSVSVSPSATVPTMPAQAKKNSPEGAAAFVKHYIDVFNYAAKTGDVDELHALSRSCEPCDKYENRFVAIYKRGDRITAHLWTLKAIDIETDETTRVIAGIDVDEGDGVRRNKLVFTLPVHQPFTVSNIAIQGNS